MESSSLFDVQGIVVVYFQDKTWVMYVLNDAGEVASLLPPLSSSPTNPCPTAATTYSQAALTILYPTTVTMALQQLS